MGLAHLETHAIKTTQVISTSALALSDRRLHIRFLEK